MKVVNQQDKKKIDKTITLRSVVFRLCQISGHFDFFPSGFVVANETQEKYLNEANKLNKQGAGKLP